MYNLVVNWLVGFKTKLIAIGLAILMFSAWILKIKRDARKEGEQRYRQKIDEETKKVEDAWKKIDTAPADVDSSLSRLRKRSADRGYGPPP